MESESHTTPLAYFLRQDKVDRRMTMTALYLLLLALLALGHHSHWGQLHPWTAWFVILVLAAIVDLVAHRRLF